MPTTGKKSPSMAAERTEDERRSDRVRNEQQKKKKKARQFHRFGRQNKRINVILDLVHCGPLWPKCGWQWLDHSRTMLCSSIPTPPPSSPSLRPMALHHSHQPYQSQQQPRPSISFRNLYGTETLNSPAVAYCNFTSSQDEIQHPPYVPPFHVVGLASGPIPITEGSEGGADLQWSYGLAPNKKILKEQEFLETNSPISSLDFVQARSVSTGLGLSLDYSRLTSTCDSGLISLIGEDINSELQRQDVEIARFLKTQGERLRQTIIDKVQASQLQTIAFMEERIFQKLREKEAEVESIDEKNILLEEKMEQLAAEANAWQQRARHNENMIATLKLNLQVYAQNRDSKEGCGDSEVDDTASCCNGRSIDFHLLCKENNGMKESLTCKVCRVNEVCMLLVPCHHLCLCKDCESKLSFCPLCQSSKSFSMEVYI